jgi:nucleotide-binding universal stress UspA family protein
MAYAGNPDFDYRSFRTTNTVYCLPTACFLPSTTLSFLLRQRDNGPVTRLPFLGSREVPMLAIKTILVPTDFSEASESAVKYGKALAEAFGSSLHLVHVMEDLLAHAWAAEVYVASMPSLRDEIEKEATERIGAMLTDQERQQLRVTTAIIAGNPFLEIIRYARAHEVDLIVLGTHGRGPVAHMLLGSVAEKVVRKAPCPVLTVRPAQHEFVMP